MIFWSCLDQNLADSGHSINRFFFFLINEKRESVPVGGIRCGRCRRLQGRRDPVPEVCVRSGLDPWVRDERPKEVNDRLDMASCIF